MTETKVPTLADSFEPEVINKICDLVILNLNEMLRRDVDAMDKLFNNRVPCNKELADHPSVQVAVQKDGSFGVNFLGVINGIIGTISSENLNGFGFIAAYVVDNERVLGFRRTDYFDTNEDLGEDDTSPEKLQAIANRLKPIPDEDPNIVDPDPAI